MKTIHATFENGVFHPTVPVELPEHCQVEFEPRMVEQFESQPTDPQFENLAPGMAKVYAILSRRYDRGEPDLAA